MKAAIRPVDWMLRQLPVAMTEDEFFSGFVKIFQEVGTSTLERIDSLEHFADPRLTPPVVLPYLASWIGLPQLDTDLDEDLQRRIVEGAGQVIQRRGTAWGLAEYIELLTGSAVTVVDSGGVYRQGQTPAGPLDPVAISLADTGGWLRDGDLLDLVRDEIPAHVVFTLDVGGRRIWPEPPADTETADTDEEGA